MNRLPAVGTAAAGGKAQTPPLSTDKTSAAGGKARLRYWLFDVSRSKKGWFPNASHETAVYLEAAMRQPLPS
jgi:hypothetical protein